MKNNSNPNYLPLQTLLHNRTKDGGEDNASFSFFLLFRSRFTEVGVGAAGRKAMWEQVQRGRSMCSKVGVGAAM